MQEAMDVSVDKLHQGWCEASWPVLPPKQDLEFPSMGTS